MVGHISVPNVTGDDTPASLSEKMISEVLRQDLGFKGIVITDYLNDRTIVKNYSAADAAVKAIQAGADLLLEPDDLDAAYEGVLKAVKKGDITEQMMYNTFNMGIGMVVAVDPADVDKTMEAIRQAGDAPYVVGKNHRW